MTQGIWYAWGLVFPESRVIGMAGGLWFDWLQVEHTLRRHGIELDPVLESWLRYMIGVVMRVENAAREKERAMTDAKTRR